MLKKYHSYFVGSGGALVRARCRVSIRRALDSAAESGCQELDDAKQTVIGNSSVPTRPLIGILCSTNAVFGENGRTAVDRYVSAIDQAGLGDIVCLPSSRPRGGFETLLAPLDGLVLTGSPINIEVRHCGIEASADLFDGTSDAAALGLVRAAARIGKPVLGICRGLQQINVALGGSLRRGLADAGRSAVHHAPTSIIALGMFNWNHGIIFEEGGLLRGAMKSHTALVNSVHFRGIDRLADELRVEARAFSDGQIEAVSARRGPMLAVQWHPEGAPHNPVSRAVFDIFAGMLATGKTGVMTSACRQQPRRVARVES
jgi:putative glutamine amidotransferase